MRVMFEVPFVEGQRRPHFTARGGHPHAYKDDRDRALERTIAAAYTEAGGELARRGVPVHLWVSTFKPLPKRAAKSVESAPDVTKPDVDNVVKLVMDALNGVAWEDDEQVTFLLASKADRERDEGRPFTVVTVATEEDHQDEQA